MKYYTLISFKHDYINLEVTNQMMIQNFIYAKSMSRKTEY